MSLLLLANLIDLQAAGAIALVSSAALYLAVRAICYMRGTSSGKSCGGCVSNCHGNNSGPAPKQLVSLQSLGKFPHAK